MNQGTSGFRKKRPIRWRYAELHAELEVRCEKHFRFSRGGLPTFTAVDMATLNKQLSLADNPGRDRQRLARASASVAGAVPVPRPVLMRAICAAWW